MSKVTLKGGVAFLDGVQLWDGAPAEVCVEAAPGSSGYGLPGAPRNGYIPGVPVMPQPSMGPSSGGAMGSGVQGMISKMMSTGAPPPAAGPGGIAGVFEISPELEAQLPPPMSSMTPQGGKEGAAPVFVIPPGVESQLPPPMSGGGAGAVPAISLVIPPELEALLPPPMSQMSGAQATPPKAPAPQIPHGMPPPMARSAPAVPPTSAPPKKVMEWVSGMVRFINDQNPRVVLAGMSRECEIRITDGLEMRLLDAPNTSRRLAAHGLLANSMMVPMMSDRCLWPVEVLWLAHAPAEWKKNCYLYRHNGQIMYAHFDVKASDGAGAWVSATVPTMNVLIDVTHADQKPRDEAIQLSQEAAAPPPPPVVVAPVPVVEDEEVDGWKIVELMIELLNKQVEVGDPDAAAAKFAVEAIELWVSVVNGEESVSPPEPSESSEPSEPAEAPEEVSTETVEASSASPEAETSAP